MLNINILNSIVNNRLNNVDTISVISDVSNKLVKTNFDYVLSSNNGSVEYTLKDLIKDNILTKNEKKQYGFDIILYENGIIKRDFILNNRPNLGENVFVITNLLDSTWFKTNINSKFTLEGLCKNFIYLHEIISPAFDRDDLLIYKYGIYSFLIKNE